MGLRPELEFWKPRVWGEVFEAWQLCWYHLYSVSHAWKPERRQLANRVLVEAGLHLVYYKSVSKEIIKTLFELTEDDATDKRQFTHGVIRELRSRSNRLPKGVVSKLRHLDKKLTGESFWDHFCRFVLNTSWDEDYSVKGEKVKELSAPSKRLTKLVEEVAKESALLSDNLSKIISSEGHRLVEFGQKLAIKLNSDTMVRQVIDAQLKTGSTKNTQFIGGYFIGLREHNPERWEQCINKLLESERTRDLGVTVIQWSGMPESLLRSLLEMYRRRDVKTSAFSWLALNITKECLPTQLVEDVVRALVTSGEEKALVVAIELIDHYFFNKEQPKGCDEELLFKLLTTPYFFRHDLDIMVGYHWHSVAKGFRTRFPDRDIELLRIMLSQVEYLSGVRSSYPTQIADAIARAHPDETWSMISIILESSTSGSWWLATWLGEFGFEENKRIGPIEAFNAEAIMQWIMKNPMDRARKVLRCLPKTLNESCGGKLTRLFIETFGDHEDLAMSLMGHFWTGGWVGSESEYLARKRDKAREWISQIESGKILNWLYRYIEDINQRIAEAELREERRY